MKASTQLIVRDFLSHSPKEYQRVWQAMKAFTKNRGEETPDELWLLEHEPVYTLGQAGKQSHILKAGDIPVVNIDRGGQVTYHGPGQLMCYTLLDLKRYGLSVRELVVLLEDVVIEVLASFGISASGDRDAPGVYVDDKKIAALGLRISRGKSYHGLCLNVNFDAGPFLGINPCGYEGMQVTQLREYLSEPESLEKPLLMHQVARQLVAVFVKRLGVPQGFVEYLANPALEAEN